MYEEKQIKELAKELCKKSCHHICEDTTDCIVEEEAEEVIANSTTTTDEQIEEIIIDLLTNFDEMGFVPTTPCPDPEAYAIEWKEKLTKALKGYRSQSEGEWIDLYKGKYANPVYSCTVCGKGTLLTHYVDELCAPKVVQALSPYCPHCGSKMKGGAE